MKNSSHDKSFQALPSRNLMYICKKRENFFSVRVISFSNMLQWATLILLLFFFFLLHTSLTVLRVFSKRCYQASQGDLPLLLQFNDISAATVDVVRPDAFDDADVAPGSEGWHFVDLHHDPNHHRTRKGHPPVRLVVCAFSTVAPPRHH